ncbi:MAG: hypothetical protein R3C05_22720 [Pirellulaceae bacterium]
MDQIRSQVARVRRRLMLQKFGRSLCWTMFAALLVALAGLAVQKVWPVPFDGQTWRLMWLAGSALSAVLLAAAIAWFTSPSPSDAAIAMDRQFGLKERLSSSLALTTEELESQIGQALLADATRRAEKLNVSEPFGQRVQRIALRPLIPLVMMSVLIFIPDATRENEAQASVETSAETQIKNAAKELQKKIALRRKRAEAQGLKDAGDLFKKIESELDALSKQKNMDQKKAMIALNDIKKQLQERRDQMGSKEDMRKQLAGLKNMERGPADKLASAMEKAEFGKAEQEIKKLIKELTNGTLSKEDQKKLENQVAKMQEALEKAVEKHEKSKQDLQQKIEQAKKEGRSEDAQNLEKQLQQMEQMDQQMQQMKQMADGLAKAKQALQNADASSAAEALDQLAEELGEMQNEMEQLEEMMDQLSQTKQQMRCEGCNGQGCKRCQGQGNQFGQAGGKGDGGDGLGEGEGGFGDRPEQETETGTYESQVRDRLRTGMASRRGLQGVPIEKGSLAKKSRMPS